MNLLSRIYIINDLGDLSHVHIALVTVGYNFSLLVVQGIKCVINLKKKRRRNLCVFNQNIVSKFN